MCLSNILGPYRIIGVNNVFFQYIQFNLIVFLYPIICYSKFKILNFKLIIFLIIVFILSFFFIFIVLVGNYFTKNLTIFIICAAIFLFLLAIILVIIIYRKKTNVKTKKHFINDVEGSVASRDPLIPGQLLKDLIDHTSSGSGNLVIL